MVSHLNKHCASLACGVRMTNETPQQAANRFVSKLLNKGFIKQALHEYQTQEGKTIYWRIRLKHSEKNEKWIRPMHCNEQGEFVLGEPTFQDKKPLYGLPSIISNPDAVIWIVEGEYCADKLAKLGLIVTTSGGAESVSNVDWISLANRKVIIWPDNDEAGLRYADQVTAELKKLNCKIDWIDINQLQLPNKGDCIDWLKLHPKASLEEINSLPFVVTSPEPESSQNFSYYPFVLDKNGVFYCDEENKLWICSKLEVIALTRDDRSENWGRLLQLEDADKRVHLWAMPMQMLKGNGEELCGELLRLGLQIAPGSRYRKLLLEYITTIKTEHRALCVNRTGWYHNVFVLPDCTFGETSDKVIYQAETLVKDYKQSSSLENWQQHVAKICVGNSRLVLAVSCAFAAMLLHFIGAESGGIHFVGESSSGKTTALRVAASVYGAPDYLSRWRATTNGLEALAALRSDTLLILDELAQVDPKEAGEIAYMLANGMGKARAGRTGTARSRYEWRLLFLSAGEINLAQHMREAGKSIKAGQEVRLVDIPADTGSGFGIFENLHNSPSPAALSKAFLDATTQHYGVAAYEFLKQITSAQNLEQIPQLLKTLREEFLTANLSEKASGQVHRVCERFALIAIAGEIATYYGITGWTTGEAQQAAQKCFQAWVEHRGGVGNQERVAILSQVRSFFELHGESRFTEWDNLNSRTLNRAGFKKTENGITNFYVLPETFRKDICAGIEHRNVLKLLLEENWLKPDAKGNPYRLEYLPGLARSRCYVFTGRMWENDV